MKQIKMTVDAWIEINDNPRQRNTQFHSKRAVKNHLSELSETHCRVAAAELPNGTQYKLDGHTRAYLWARDLLEKPKLLFCDLYKVKDIGEAIELYQHFDNQMAVETSGDKLAGALNLYGISQNSRMWTNGGATTALKAIYTNITVGISKVDIADCVKPFAKALKLVESCGFHHPHFPAPVLTALILTVHLNGTEALSFWTAYDKDEGKKTSKSMDSVYCMTDLVRTWRADHIFARGSRRAVYECVPKMLATYEKWGAKLFQRSPKPEGDFRHYIETYCGDVFDQLSWREDGRGRPKKENSKQRKLKL